MIISIGNADPEMQKYLEELLSRGWSDKEVIHAYHMREMAIMDYNSGMGQARKKAKKKQT
jgi:hypothetical protein